VGPVSVEAGGPYGCEGGCGCELTGDMREVADGVTTVLVHTVERCRLIRTLREAGQAAVGDGSSVVRIPRSPEAFIVHVSRVWRGRVSIEAASTTYQDVQAVVAAETAWLHSPDRLEALGAWVEENIRRALRQPHATWGWLPGPVIARDPYRGRP
jgi:hypothetical protein